MLKNHLKNIYKIIGYQLFSGKHLEIRWQTIFLMSSEMLLRISKTLDLLTPNRLLLARNNSRCPVGSVNVTEDVGKIIQQNNKVFEMWFLKVWLTSYVPTLMLQPIWF